MKKLEAGHSYELANFANPNSTGQVLNFINKQPNPTNPTELETIHDGTTNEELLAVLIDRTKYLQNKFPCEENAVALTHLHAALQAFNDRTANRIARGVEGKQIK